jgi:hypothetical protein
MNLSFLPNYTLETLYLMKVATTKVWVMTEILTALLTTCKDTLQTREIAATNDVQVW